MGAAASAPGESTAVASSEQRAPEQGAQQPPQQQLTKGRAWALLAKSEEEGVVVIPEHFTSIGAMARGRDRPTSHAVAMTCPWCFRSLRFCSQGEEPAL